MSDAKHDFDNKLTAVLAKHIDGFSGTDIS